MKRNLLLAVKTNTSPITEDEFNKFLLKRHGSASRGNASADPSALNSFELESLKNKQNTDRKYIAVKGVSAKRNAGLIKAISKANGVRKTASTGGVSPSISKKKSISS